MARTFIVRLMFLIAVSVLMASNAWAHPPWGIVVDRQGQIYFSGLEAIWKIDAKGKLTVFRSNVSGRHTHEMNMDEAGNLYGEDLIYEPETQRRSVALWKMTPAGVFTYILGPTYNAPEGAGVWKDRDGNTYSAQWNNSTERQVVLLRRSPSGNVTTLFGSQKAVSEHRQVLLSDIGGMTFGADGAVYFTEGPNFRKVTMDGRATSLVSNLAVENPAESPMPESRVTRLFGVAVDAQGNALVADYGNRRVLKFTPDGKMTTLIRTERPWSPSGVTIFNGELYILEFGFTLPSTTNGFRVQKLAADGKVTILGTVGEREMASAENGSTAENSSTAENDSTAENSSSVTDRQSSVTPNHLPVYAFIGAGTGAFALTIVAWQLFRKRTAQRQL